MNALVTCNMNGTPHDKTCGCIDPRAVDPADALFEEALAILHKNWDDDHKIHIKTAAHYMAMFALAHLTGERDESLCSPTTQETK